MRKSGGADSLYFAFAKHLSERLSPYDNRVILVTSDGPLYRATLANPTSKSSISGLANAGIVDISAFRKRDVRKFVPVAGKYVRYVSRAYAIADTLSDFKRMQ